MNVWDQSMKILYTVLLNILCISCQDSVNNINTELSERLKPFEPYIWKKFKGHFSSSTTEKPIYDISHWEWALNGNAIRIKHSVNNGEFGGESIVMWDSHK